MGVRKTKSVYFCFMTRRITLIGTLLMTFVFVRAQDPASILQRLTDSFPQERIHIHYNKNTYFSGETIWFKAYLYNGFVPSDLSTNFFVELRNSNNQIVAKKQLPIFSSTVIGSFELSDTVAPGYYTVRAYTPWMLNFKEDFLYERSIYIYKPSKQSRPITNQKPQFKINFFPEGGELVKSVVNVVAFKASDQYGNPVACRGRLIDGEGNELATLQSVHDGMGSFGYIPAGNNKYFAEISFSEGPMEKVELPVAKETGWVMQVREESESRKRIILMRPAGGSSTKLLLVGQMQQQMVLSQIVNVNGNNALVSVDTKNFPSGILQLTLMDEGGLPIAERLSFINNQDFRYEVKLKTDLKSLQSKGRNQMSFSMPDSLIGSYSVSIVDDERVLHHSTASNIVSSLLLTSDLKGYIHNPDFYLAQNDKSTRVALDLLMMTHGWRRFSWTETLANRFPAIKFRDKNYIQISGNIFSQKTKKPVTSGEVNFIYRTKDSSTDFLQVAVDEKGGFEIDNLSYQDTAAFSFQLNSQKNKEKEILIELIKDSIDYFLYSNKLETKRYEPNMPEFNQDSAEIFFAYSADASGKFTELETITVVAKKKKPIEELNERYTTGLFSTMTMARVYDLVNNDPGAGALHVFQYIQGRVPGLRVITQGFPPSYTVVSGRAMSLTGGPIPVPLFLDEMPATSQQLVSVSMREVAMIKYFPTGFMGNPGIGSTQALVVYTKKGGDAIRITKDFLNAFQYPGYSVVREFYSPDYEQNPNKINEADKRTTILWQPEIKQDADSGRYLIKFFNSDKAKKLKLVLEGMLSDGRMIHQEMMITD